MGVFGRCCMVTLVVLVLAHNRIYCSPLNTVLSEDISPCFHDCSIKAGFCENGGTCIKLDTVCSANSFSCLCPPGFSGSRCNTVSEPCKYDILYTDFNCNCQNEATCVKIGDECAPSSYLCECGPGFEGASCETPVPADILLKNPTVPSTESTKSPANSTRSSSTTADRVSVDSSYASASIKNVSMETSTPPTVAIVINITVSLGKILTTTETKSAPQTTLPPDERTPGLKLIPLMRKILSQQTDPQLCSKCVHGQCLENETGAKCVCKPGYYGEYCDSQCLKQCLHGGTCTYSNGVESCRCDALYSGEFCEKKRAFPSGIPTPLVTTESQIASESEKNIYKELYGKRFCAANFECIHGVCNSSDHRYPKCLCQEGFIGDFCQVKCAKKCLNEGKCLIVNGTEKCNCPKGYQGKLCEKRLDYEFDPLALEDPLSVRKEKSQTPQARKTVKGSRRSSMYELFQRLKSPYLVRKDESRDPKECAANFVCIHGVCDKSIPDTPRCLCDKGYIGSLCHHECSLKCVNSGECIVQYGQQYCNCKFGFQGKLCERKVYNDNVKRKETHYKITETISTVAPLSTTLSSSADSVIQ